MMDAKVVVSGLRKVYRVPEREAGLAAAVRSLAHRRYRDVLAVDGISLTVQAGEMVGFIGPNGAGKTTTLKMLAGLLYPTAGEATVRGFVPWERKPDFLVTAHLLQTLPVADLLVEDPPIEAVIDRIYQEGGV